MSKSQGKSTLETEEGVERDVENPTGGGADATVEPAGQGGGTGGVKIGTRGEGGGGGSQKIGPRTDLAEE